MHYEQDRLTNLINTGRLKEAFDEIWEEGFEAGMLGCSLNANPWYANIADGKECMLSDPWTAGCLSGWRLWYKQIKELRKDE